MCRWRDLTLDEIPAEIIKVEDHEHKSNGLIAKKSPDEEVTIFFCYFLVLKNYAFNIHLKLFVFLPHKKSYRTMIAME